jgi:hypothetical protein
MVEHEGVLMRKTYFVELNKQVLLKSRCTAVVVVYGCGCSRNGAQQTGMVVEGMLLN